MLPYDQQQQQQNRRNGDITRQGNSYSGMNVGANAQIRPPGPIQYKPHPLGDSLTEILGTAGYTPTSLTNPPVQQRPQTQPPTQTQPTGLRDVGTGLRLGGTRTPSSGLTGSIPQQSYLSGDTTRQFSGLDMRPPPSLLSSQQQGGDITRVGNTYSGMNVGAGGALNGQSLGIGQGMSELEAMQRSQLRTAQYDAQSARNRQLHQMRLNQMDGRPLDWDPSQQQQASGSGSNWLADRERQNMINRVMTPHAGAQNRQLTMGQMRLGAELMQSGQENQATGLRNAQTGPSLNDQVRTEQLRVDQLLGNALNRERDQTLQAQNRADQLEQRGYDRTRDEQMRLDRLDQERYERGRQARLDAKPVERDPVKELEVRRTEQELARSTTDRVNEMMNRLGIPEEERPVIHQNYGAGLNDLSDADLSKVLAEAKVRSTAAVLFNRNSIGGVRSNRLPDGGGSYRDFQGQDREGWYAFWADQKENAPSLWQSFKSGDGDNDVYVTSDGRAINMAQVRKDHRWTPDMEAWMLGKNKGLRQD